MLRNKGTKEVGSLNTPNQKYLWTEIKEEKRKRKTFVFMDWKT